MRTVNKNDAIQLCLNCTVTADCDGNIGKHCPILLTAVERKKQALQERIDLYQAIEKQIETEGPLLSSDITKNYKVTQSLVTAAIKSGILLTREKRNGRFLYQIVGVDLDKLVNQKRFL